MVTVVTATTGGPAPQLWGTDPMNRSTLARRYAPLVALAAIQLLIIATVPSTAAKRVVSQANTGSGGFAAGQQGATPGSTDTGSGAPRGGNAPAGGTVGGLSGSPGGTTVNTHGRTDACR